MSDQYDLAQSREVPVARLRRECDPQALAVASSAEVPASRRIIGQPRATAALQFGLGIKAQGFNIFVSGVPGTGRATTVTRYLEMVAGDRPVPPDWCYVFNFRDPVRPCALSMPAGHAQQFVCDMQALVERAGTEIRAAFESDAYTARRAERASAIQQQAEALQARVNEAARQAGFVIQASQAGLMTVPLNAQGRPMTQEEFVGLSPAEQGALAEKQRGLQGELETLLRQMKSVGKNAAEALAQLDREVGLFAIGHLIDELREKHKDLPAVAAHVEAVREDMLDNLARFRAVDQEQGQAQPVPVADADFLRRYAVNVLVDNADLKGVPVVMEMNPTYANLFGRVESEARMGTLVADFTLIRNGSLHRANGGYLVIPAEDLLREEGAWENLKRALRNRQVLIADAGELGSVPVVRTVQPEAIPLDTKVVLIGQPMTQMALQAGDEDFPELFKVKAEFTLLMDRAEATERDYAVFVSGLCAGENLRHLDGSALAQLVELGSRLAEDQDKLSTHFGALADVIREADYYAGLENATYVTAAHVLRAIEQRFYRSNLMQERLQEMVARETFLIDVQGTRVGQVNALTVYDLGDVSFGHPRRITATAGVGRDGVIDIERESELSGPTHTKGVLILAGYLIEKYAQEKPLSLSARLVFEQSYTGVEGDSASAAELYALLSELSGLPIRQAIAITGSVNQKGETQAIGGVNQKIEGFFEICKLRGLSGEQGVLIPAANVRHLMLKEEVVAAVRDGKFHIWAVKTIDEGIEVLTGVAAGARQADGSFPPGSVNARVDARLCQMAETMARFGRNGHPV